MTSKLKCPFCGEELEDAGTHSAGFYFWCTNCYMKQKEKDDNYTASPRIWQALIQAKQDLGIARKALEDIDMLLHSRKFDITELGRLNIIQHLVSRVLKLTEHKE